ncbi:MAG: DDE-type integrase/transposase/recombinase [Candidatus Cloacimonetes bacterium]|nr:DDE-type integrase/transposase/recombinase [Candidatus Cloacimonadota bacterium]
MEFSSRTYQRWKKNPFNEDLRKGPKHSPSKLTEHEISEIVTILSSKDFVDLPACQIVPRLADKGIYHASESSIYRIIKKYGLGKHRTKSKRPRKIAKPKPAKATVPNQVRTWDITYLPTKVKGQFVYLYLILDLFSRKIVGWRIHEEQSSEHSSALVRECMFKEKLTGRNLKLHSDNGGPMKSCMMLSSLQELGVMPSFSRPSVSNDNPY